MHYPVNRQSVLENTRDNITFAPVVGQKRKSEWSQSPVLKGTIQVRKAWDVSNVAAKSRRIRASRILSNKDEHEDPTIEQYEATPAISQHTLLSLDDPQYGLPLKLAQNFRELGVRSIYHWQSHVLLRSGVLHESRNLVYTAPTGGGKSLVADVALVDKIVKNPGKKGLLVLPYVALVQEKTRWLRRLVHGLAKNEVSDADNIVSVYQSQNREIVVASFFGGGKTKSNFADCDLAVCTIEKANGMINQAIEDGSIADIAIVVCDELHMLDDEHRGYILEVMLTKLLTIQSNVQLIGMSATLANPQILAKWLRAKYFVAKYRPIPVHEHVVYDNKIYLGENSKEFLKTASQLNGNCPTQRPEIPIRVIEKSMHDELKNPVVNAVVALATETALLGYGALVFCSSRQATQSIAKLISETLIDTATSQEVLGRRADVLASLQVLPSGFEPVLLDIIPQGVGVHHAGLTVEEREIIAEGFDNGTLKVIVATCSLAAGINLPARRVILNSAKMGRDMVGPAMLRQMRGRAGRKGKDELGETYLCCQKIELEPVAEMLDAELPAISSCLTPQKRGIKRAVLEAIATRMLSTYEGLQEYAKNSLLWQTTSNHEIVLEMVDNALLSLLADKLVVVTIYDTYSPTALGCAVVASGLTPQDGLFIHSDLRRALSSFVMESELHLFYLFTPIPPQLTGEPITKDVSWTVLRNILDRLDEPSLRSLSIIGVSPRVINDLANSGVENLSEDTAEQVRVARIYRRAYSMFALRDICDEVPIHDISLRYGIPRGQIQNLSQTCHGFAAGMIKFCQRMASPGPPLSKVMNGTQLTQDAITAIPIDPDPQASGFSMLAAVLEHMQSRLYAGARADLLEMTQIPFVKGRMARLLYENGFKTTRALSEADPQKDILPIMLSLNAYKVKGIFRDVRNENKTRLAQTDGADSGAESEAEARHQMVKLFELRKQMLEEKLLEKARVMVRGAARLYEREVLNSVGFEEE